MGQVLAAEAKARHAARLTAQLLAGEPARDPAAVAERLLAIQGQDPRGARLAVRARSEGLTAADVDRALTDERSLLITWLNRGTLHLVRSEDYPLIHAVTTPPLRTSSNRRLAEEGVPPDHAERGVAAIERALAEEGPLSVDALRERVAAVGVRSERQAMYHLLYKASLDGRVVRGPMVGKKHAYALVRDWLGQPERVDRDEALAEFARRYLAGHGPAGERDMARWARIPLRDVRRGFQGIAGELDELGDGLVDLKARGPVAELPPPKLLGTFEEVLLGWDSREDIFGEHRSFGRDARLFDPFALAGGRAVAHWKLREGLVEIEPFGRLGKADAAALDREAQDVLRFFTIG
ncbi:MAG TPA: winged helix DNA-binding domain-containing protein [Thermoleophilaceae bacterium]